MYEDLDVLVCNSCRPAGRWKFYKSGNDGVKNGVAT